MTIPPKKYIPIGLRRDKNFSDVNDKIKSLNNLLNNLEGPGTFVSEDLDCIRGLYNEKVTANNLYDLAGISVLISPKDIPIRPTVNATGNIITTSPENASLVQVDDVIKTLNGVVTNTSIVTINKTTGVITLSNTYVSNTSQDVIFTKASNSPILAEPLITIKDRVDNVKLITGNIPSYQGGLGLEARFVPSTKVNVGNTSSNGSTIFNAYNSSTDLPKEIYWERGVFKFSSKIDPTFPDVYGGIQWEGFFSPYIKDSLPSIGVRTTGLAMVEWDEFEDGNYTTLISWYAKDRTVTPTLNASGTTITIANTNTKYIGINDFIKNTDGTVSNIQVTSIDRTTGEITVSSNFTSSTGTPITFTKVLGDTETVGYAYFKPIEPGTMLKIRLSYWFPVLTNPTEIASVKQKEIRFNYIGEEFYFAHLYKSKPAAPGLYEIRTFLNNATLPYQPNIGAPKTTTNGDNYKNLNINGSYVSYYIPKTSFDDIKTAGPFTITTKANDNVIVSSGDMSNVQIGNYVVPATYSDYVALGNPGFQTQIKGDFNSLNLRYVTNAYSTATSSSVNFIDHKGLIGWYFANTSNTNMTINSTSKLREQYVVVSTVNTNFERILLSNTVAPTNSIILTSNVGLKVGQIVSKTGFIQSNTTISSITGNTIIISKTTTADLNQGNTILLSPNTTVLRVNSITNSSVFVASEYLGDTVNTNTIIYIYSDKALIDSSKDIFCAGVFGKVTASNVASGTNSIILVNNTAITSGLFVQLDGSIPSNTTISSVTGNTITLSNTTTGAFLTGTTLTFTTSNVNKEACVIPLDTSPPFVGTSVGLKTANRGLKGNSSISTFTVVTKKFSATVNTANVSSVSGVQQYDRKLTVYANSSATFSILGKTV